VQALCFQRESALQGFHQRHIFGDVVVLPANPLRNSNWTSCAAAENDTNAGGAWISQRSAINICYEIRHCFSGTYGHDRSPQHERCTGFRQATKVASWRASTFSFQLNLCIPLWKNSRNFIAGSSSSNKFNGLRFCFRGEIFSVFAPKNGVDFSALSN
jgi:hypothetical protein